MTKFQTFYDLKACLNDSAHVPKKMQFFGCIKRTHCGKRTKILFPSVIMLSVKLIVARRKRTFNVSQKQSKR